MNKQDLISEVANSTGMSKAAVMNITDSLIKTIEKSLKKGQDVQLVGFGTWKRKKRAARTGRNPKTGAMIKIAAKFVPSFSAGKKLKDSVQ
ncbi:MAG: HU family DNA-binding protein [Candidatus Margulisiibacteriota bacterium]|jgi:DNA-binding protein HU-beta